MQLGTKMALRKEDDTATRADNPDILSKKLGLEWTKARTVVGNGNRLRHPGGAEMEALHLDAPAAPIFTILHRPAGRPRGIVLVCSPSHAEAVRNHRREILLGWLASETGLAVVRFHYRGSGHSGGEAAQMTLTTMTNDGAAVAHEAVARLGVPVIGFMGTRLGAVVAHRVAVNHPGTAVAWWQPVLDANSYMRELLRASMIGGLKRGVSTNRRELEDLLQSEGMLDVLGSPISRQFCDSLTSDPLDDAPEGPRAGFLVQLSRHDELQQEHIDFVERLSAHGWTMRTLSIAAEETWWFGARGRGAEYELRSTALEVVPATVEFFKSHSAISGIE